MRAHITYSIATFCLLCLGACTAQDHRDPNDAGWQLNELDMATRDLAQGEDLSNLVECGDSTRNVNHYNNGGLSVLEGCQRLMGGLNLVDYYGTDVHQAKSLIYIEKSLYIRRVTELESLSDFEKLEEIESGDLLLDSLYNLSKESGFPNLRKVGGRINIASLPVDKLRFPNLEYTEGLSVVGTPEVTSLEGLEKLKRIDGDLLLDLPNVSREELDRFLERVDVMGRVRFNGELIQE